eukprot:15465515-Alexandrium_andersonii.AAC.1
MVNTSVHLGVLRYPQVYTTSDHTVRLVRTNTARSRRERRQEAASGRQDERCEHSGQGHAQ